MTYELMVSHLQLHTSTLVEAIGSIVAPTITFCILCVLNVLVFVSTSLEILEVTYERQKYTVSVRS